MVHMYHSFLIHSSADVPLIYVNETICMVICLLQDSSQSFYGLGWIIWCQDYHKMRFRDRGLVPFWILRHSFLFINRLPVTIWHPAEDWQGVLFLPPSDAHVRSFLYLLYTLIKLYYQKLWVIQPRLWPRIEFDSSRGQESRRFIVQQHLSCSTMISSKEICYKILNCPHHFIGHKSKVKSLIETLK